MKRISTLKILGLNGNATPDEIKKAYRKLSIKYHPDKNNGIDIDDRFRNLNNAYEYLTCKHDDDSAMNFEFETGDGGIPIEIIKMMFGMAGGSRGRTFETSHSGWNGQGGGGGGQSSSRAPQFELHDLFGNIDDIKMFSGNMPLEKPPPIVQKVTISIEDCYNGCNIPINITRWHKMPGMHEEIETIYIDIKSGIDNNEMIIIREKGHIIHDNLCGDVKIFVNIDETLPDKTTPFKRNGLDMEFKVDISLKDALCGSSFELKHLSGQQFTLRNNKLISPGMKVTLNELGFKRDDSIGKIIIFYNIIFPNKLELSQIESLKTIL